MKDFNFKLDGVLDSPIDERDYTYDMISRESTTKLPDSFKLTYQFEPKNQGQVGSCVAHCLSAMKEIIDSTTKLLSPGFIYYNRAESDYQGTGMITREALKRIIEYGICDNNLLPINIEYPEIVDIVNKSYNTMSLYENAKNHKSLSYIKINDTEEIKQFIYNEQKPVVVSINVYPSLYETKNGIVPQCTGKKTGSHSVLAVGWTKDGYLIILNSWGKWGGADGYIYLNEKDPLLFKEFWGVTDVLIKRPVEPVTPLPPNVIRPNENTIYKVQLGAFKIRENADNLMKQLATKNIASCIVIYPTLYKVQVGAFKVKENADIMLKKMKDLGYTDAYIVEVI